MAMKSLNPAEKFAIVGVVSPDALTAAVHSSEWVDLGKFGSIAAIVSSGVLGASATLDAKLEQATSDDGAGAKDIAGAAITQLTKAGGDDGAQAVLQCWGEDLDMNEGFRFVRLVMTVAGATSDGSGMVLGFDPRHGPAKDVDLDTVKEIVTL